MKILFSFVILLVLLSGTSHAGRFAVSMANVPFSAENTISFSLVFIQAVADEEVLFQDQNFYELVTAQQRTRIVAHLDQKEPPQEGSAIASPPSQ